MSLPSQSENCTRCTECNGDFPKKDKAGPCGRCYMIEHVSKHDGIDSARYSDLISREQCRGCGTVGKNFVNGYCYNCRAPELDPAEQIRISTFQTQMKEGKQRWEISAALSRNPPPSLPPACPSLPPAPPHVLGPPVNPPPPSIPLNSESLNRRRDVDLFQIKVEVRSTAKKGPIHLLGPSNFSHFPDKFVPDVLNDDILPLYNRFFTSELKAGLEAGDVALRWKNNRLFRSGTEYGTLRDVYNEHITQPNAVDFFRTDATKKKPAAGVTMHWELLIIVDKYEERTGYVIPSQLGGNSRKRARGQQEDDNDTPSAKRTTQRPVTTYRPGPLRTQFRGTPVQGPASTKVRLQFSRIQLDNTGQVICDSDDSYTWDPPQDGTINDTYTSKGRLKRVYQLIMGNGVKYAAKRLYAGGLHKLTPQYNNRQLEIEVLTQKLGAYMLRGFYAQAEKMGVNLEEEFAFTECFLAREIIGSIGSPVSPSPASGLSRLDYEHHKQDDPSFELLWLIEPLRVAQDQKWSTQLMFNSPNPSRKQMVMDAFAHWTYVASEETTVFADLQSSPHRLANGFIQEILFDATTHTIWADEEESENDEHAICDHGRKGLKLFIQQHRCDTNILCQELKLPPLPGSVPSPNVARKTKSRRKPKPTSRMQSLFSREGSSDDFVNTPGNIQIPDVQSDDELPNASEIRAHSRKSWVSIPSDDDETTAKVYEGDSVEDYVNYGDDD